ncbi:MAG: TRAP transporter small permease subunit [Zoogloeaceae bacterium]|nr:TRAP transporter small permease subunit [Zoogloeaceae bacterium]
MTPLLNLARGVDRLNAWVGKSVIWLILIAVLISAGNAIVRKVFNYSSNALLELQWYLFSAVFLLGAAYTLQRNEHVRIDVIAGKFSKRTQTWIDVFGTVFFLLPVTIMVLWLSWPVFTQSFHSQDYSNSAGGLILWPARLLVPVGFLLLTLQGFSELIKRLAFLAGAGPDPTDRHGEKSAEEELAEAIRRAEELKQQEPRS